MEQPQVCRNPIHRHLSRRNQQQSSAEQPRGPLTRNTEQAQRTDRCTRRCTKSTVVPAGSLGRLIALPIDFLLRLPLALRQGDPILLHSRGLLVEAPSSSDAEIDDINVFTTLVGTPGLLASGLDGAVYVWDRRLSNHPCLEFTSSSQGQLNSLQLDSEDRIVFGASKHGIIYAWDLRGGRTSFAFQSHNQVYYPLLTSVKVSSVLEKIPSLKAQSNILSKEIHSISFNPSCPYQLAFHLDDGWSGVLNISSLNVTHMHCPPPAWLDGSISTTPLDMRKPSWLPMFPIYAVGSSSGNGIYLLDFYPDTSSACHVDFNEELHDISEEPKCNAHNKFIPTSETVLVCAAHPLNGTIIAGTKQSSLLVVSQKLENHKDLDCTS